MVVGSDNEDRMVYTEEWGNLPCGPGRIGLLLDPSYPQIPSPTQHPLHLSKITFLRRTQLPSEAMGR